MFLSQTHSKTKVLAILKQDKNLASANLKNMDLSGVDLSKVNLSNANLEGAKLDLTYYHNQGYLKFINVK